MKIGIPSKGYLKYLESKLSYESYCDEYLIYMRQKYNRFDYQKVLWSIIGAYPNRQRDRSVPKWN